MNWRKTIALSVALLFPSLCLSGGGPDEAGYRWIDSDSTGGPTFNWSEIGSVGTQIPLGDDDNLGPFGLGFSFTYYGAAYDSVRVCSNGWLSFRSQSHQLHPFPIPCREDPNALLSPFWFDLDPSAGGMVCYYPDTSDSQFVVAWYGVPPYGGSGGYTFQVVLEEEGTVLFNYKRLQSSAGVDSTSVGIEDGDGLIGLQYFRNGTPPENLLHDSLTIKLYQLDHDVMPTMAHSPLPRVFPDVAVIPRVTVKNYGKSQETFTVKCQISDSATGGFAYQDSATVVDLSPRQETFLELPSPWIPEILSTYEVSFITLLSEDEDPSNDTLTRCTTCSYQAEMAYDDEEADTFRYVGGAPTVHWATTVRFTPPFSPYRILSGRVLVEDTSPFEEMLICPDDGTGEPDVDHPYGRAEWVSAPSPHDWAGASFDTVVNSSEDIWLVAVWPLAATSPRVGEDTDPPIDTRSFYGIPGVHWVQWAAGDWIMRIEIDLPVGVQEVSNDEIRMTKVELFQNCPNPFAANTLIRFRLSADRRPPTANDLSTYERINLSVYDLSGRLVRTLVDEALPTCPAECVSCSAGTPHLSRGMRQLFHWDSLRPISVVWDGRDSSGKRMPSGIYLYRLATEDFTATKKMVLLR